MEESEFIDVQGKWGKSFVEIPNPVKPGEVARFKLTPELVGNPPPEYWNKTDLREAAQMALDVLDDINQCSLPPTGIPLPAEIDEAMDSLRAALAQPPCATGSQCVGGKCERCAVQEPVAWAFQHEETGLIEFVDLQQVEWEFEKNNPRWQKVYPLYTAPPQREWQGLTDAVVQTLIETAIEGYASNRDSMRWLCRAIEAKLMEKNFDRSS